MRQPRKRDGRGCEELRAFATLKPHEVSDFSSVTCAPHPLKTRCVRVQILFEHRVRDKTYGPISHFDLQPVAGEADNVDAIITMHLGDGHVAGSGPAYTGES